jgi:hypothetical protein
VTSIEVFFTDDGDRRRKERSAAVLIVIAGSVLLLARKPEIRDGGGAATPMSNEAVILPARGSIALRIDVLTPGAPPTQEVVNLMPLTTTIAISPVEKATPPKERPVDDTKVGPPPPLPQPLPQPVVEPPPPIALLVNPRGLHFSSPGWRPMTITNPNAAPIRIDHVAVAGARVSAYRLDAKECDGITLQPKESCRVTVFATPAAIAGKQMITIEVAASRPE